MKIIIILILILVIIYLYENKYKSYITEKTYNKIENICFIISHKYYRTHPSFIKLYV